MIPSKALLWWVALGLFPMATLVGAVPETGLIIGPLILAGAALAAWDAQRGRRRVMGWEVDVAPLTRCTQERPVEVEFRVADRGQRGAVAMLGVAWPEVFESGGDRREVRVEAGREGRVRWSVTCRKRGRFRMGLAVVGMASPLGLWECRKTQAIQAEIRVFPSLLSERRSVAAVFLNRGMQGLHAVRQLGQGRDFEKLREYVQGDSYDDIHWKATARRGHPVTRVFQLERTQEVYVVIDASRMSQRESGDPPQPDLERFIRAALVLGLAAERQGDLFGLVVFSDRVERFVRAGSGSSHFQACRDALFALEPASVAPDYEELFVFIRQKLRRRALILVLTNLEDPLLADGFVRGVELVCRQHVVVANTMRRAHVAPMFHEEARSEADVIRALAGHVQWHKIHQVSRVLHQRGVELIQTDAATATAELLRYYIQVKNRQLL